MGGGVVRDRVQRLRRGRAKLSDAPKNPKGPSTQ